MKKSFNTDFDGELSPYCYSIPELTRPKDDLIRPTKRDEQLYCWFYWIEMILNPKHTREVLDDLERLPEFQVTWGSDWVRGNKLLDKNLKKDL